MKDLMQYEKLIQKAAWKAARACGLQHEIEDIIQEAWVAAAKALQSFNPKKGRLSTHLWQAIYFQTLNYYGKQENFPGIPDNYDIAVAGDYEFPLWFAYLETEEQEMVSYTFRTTEKKWSIINHFAEKWGYSRARQTAESLKRKLAFAI